MFPSTLCFNQPGNTYNAPVFAGYVVLDELKANRGFLRLTDNSHPEDIKTVLKMSKKNFKKALGGLYKSGKVQIVAPYLKRSMLCLMRKALKWET